MIGILLVALVAGWVAAGAGIAVVVGRMIVARDKLPMREVVPSEVLAHRDRLAR